METTGNYNKELLYIRNFLKVLKKDLHDEEDDWAMTFQRLILTPHVTELLKKKIRQYYLTP